MRGIPLWTAGGKIDGRNPQRLRGLKKPAAIRAHLEGLTWWLGGDRRLGLRHDAASYYRADDLDKAFGDTYRTAPMSDYHRLLGLPGDADPDDVRRALWQLAGRHRFKPRNAMGRRGPERIWREYGAWRRDIGRAAGPKTFRSGRAQRVAEGAAWFADEIAVDFPSVAAFVERIQAGFFRGQADDGLATDVTVTAGLAARGGTIDVTVPLCQTCPVCGGRGEVWTERCGVCTGTGGSLVPHRIQIPVPGGIRHGARLRYRVALPYVPTTLLNVRFAVQ